MADRPALTRLGFRATRALFVSVLLWAPAERADAEQVIIVTLPPSVAFAVPDVTQTVVGTPDPTAIIFTVVSLLPFTVVRASVKADSNFVPPSGSAIPASNITWDASDPVRASAFDGTMSTAVYNRVFETEAGFLGAGSVNVRWSLLPPGTSIRAGNHTITIRWRLESVVP